MLQSSSCNGLAVDPLLREGNSLDKIKLPATCDNKLLLSHQSPNKNVGSTVMILKLLDGVQNLTRSFSCRSVATTTAGSRTHLLHG